MQLRWQDALCSSQIGQFQNNELFVEVGDFTQAELEFWRDLVLGGEAGAYNANEAIRALQLALFLGRGAAKCAKAVCDCVDDDRLKLKRDIDQELRAAPFNHGPQDTISRLTSRQFNRLLRALGNNMYSRVVNDDGQLQLHGDVIYQASRLLISEDMLLSRVTHEQKLRLRLPLDDARNVVRRALERFHITEVVIVVGACWAIIQVLQVLQAWAPAQAALPHHQYATRSSTRSARLDALTVNCSTLNNGEAAAVVQHIVLIPGIRKLTLISLAEGIISLQQLLALHLLRELIVCTVPAGFHHEQLSNLVVAALPDVLEMQLMLPALRHLVVDGLDCNNFAVQLQCIAQIKQLVDLTLQIDLSSGLKEGGGRCAALLGCI